MAQYNEEVILREYFGDKKDGVVVEIGAAFHDINSNSKYLITIGWKALLVEPNRFFFNNLLSAYSNSDSVYLENCCAFSEDIDEVIFYEYGQSSTMDEQFKNRIVQSGDNNQLWHDHNGMAQIGFVENRVKAFKTSKLLRKYFDKIDFLSIDCEGSDFNVIKGIDFNDIQIQLICHEIQNDPQTNIDIENYMNSFGFSKYTTNTGNIFYENKN